MKLFLLLVALLSLSEAKKCPAENCPAYEHYSAAPIDRCSEACIGVLSDCIGCDSKLANCEPGCQCDEGYCRQDGKCIKPNPYLPPVCPTNEHYSDVPINRCQEACYGVLAFCVGCDSALANCTCGCQCDEGYCREGDKCVKPNPYLPQECPQNELFSNELVNRCSENCNSVFARCASCESDFGNCSCGCACAPGYCRYGSECVSPNPFLPPTCPENEYNSDTVVNRCAESCFSVFARCASCESGLGNCTSGCACADGFCRYEDECVFPNPYLPPECPENEHYTDIPVNRCSEGCKGVVSKCISCDLKGSNCSPGCECDEGYCREDGKCIKPNPYLPTECSATEYFSNIPVNRCGEDCFSVFARCASCESGLGNCTSGCACADGFCRYEDECVYPNPYLVELESGSEN